MLWAIPAPVKTVRAWPPGARRASSWITCSGAARRSCRSLLSSQPLTGRTSCRARWPGSARNIRTALPEVIVVDDASTDRTAEVARSLGARVVIQQENGGAAAARNTGIDAATQPSIALLDSDDEWLPHHLSTLWAAREHHVLITGASLSCGPHGEDALGGVLRGVPACASPASVVFPENLVSSSGVLVRRDVMLEIGGYRTDLRLAEDFDVWLRVLERGTGVALPTVVSLYHRHSEQKSTRIDDGRAAQRRAIDARVESDWYSKTLVRRRAVVDDWDDLRGGRPRDCRVCGTSPAPLSGSRRSRSCSVGAGNVGVGTARSLATAAPPSRSCGGRRTR